MTCPKCGKELIIGSSLCPDCDILPQKPQQQRRKLSKRGKMIIGALCFVILLALLVWAIVFALGFKVQGLENGNGINLSYAEKIGNHFYYSDGDELHGINEKFKNSEVVDKGGEIYCLSEAGGKLYYIKDDVLCRYCPKKRVKAEIMKLPAGKKAAVIGKSEKKMYFSIDGGVYLFDIAASAMQLVYSGEGVISGGKIYLAQGGSIYKINLSDGERETLCSIGEFEKPVFVKGGDIFAVNYKDMKIFTIDKKNGERKEIFNSADYSKISDVSKMNYHSGHLFLTGEDGIYKINIRSGESTLLSETGYVNSICIEDNKIFSRRFEGATYFSNMSGKVLYKEEYDAQ